MKTFLMVFALFNGALSFAGQGEKALPAAGITCVTRLPVDSDVPPPLANFRLLAKPLRPGVVQVKYEDLSSEKTYVHVSSFYPRYGSLISTMPDEMFELGKPREISFFARVGTANWVAIIKPYGFEVEAVYHVIYDCVVNE